MSLFDIIKLSRIVSFVKGVLISGAVVIGMTQHSFATKKIYTPYVEKDELEFHWKGSYDFDDDDNADGKQKEKFGIGYGITDKWFSGIEGAIEKSGVDGSDFEFTALEWQNKFQFFERGERAVDLGLFAAYEISMESDGADKAEVKLLIAKDLNKISANANITLEKQLGDNSTDGTEAGIAIGSRYRLDPMFEPGIELHSEFGPLNESKPYKEQKHMVGPVFYGKLGSFKYDIGYLFGVSDAAPDGELKWIFAYEVHL